MLQWDCLLWAASLHMSSDGFKKAERTPEEFQASGLCFKRGWIYTPLNVLFLPPSLSLSLCVCRGQRWAHEKTCKNLTGESIRPYGEATVKAGVKIYSKIAVHSKALCQEIKSRKKWKITLIQLEDWIGRMDRHGSLGSELRYRS